MDSSTEDEPHREDTRQKALMLINKSTNRAGYSGPTKDDGHSWILEDLEEHDEGRVQHIIDDEC